MVPETFARVRLFQEDLSLQTLLGDVIGARHSIAAADCSVVPAQRTLGIELRSYQESNGTQKINESDKPRQHQYHNRFMKLMKFATSANGSRDFCYNTPGIKIVPPPGSPGCPSIGLRVELIDTSEIQSAVR
jgi:hypothetical protein